jgi:murein DD-endopeptidase MepM/ murein hydrolase activator NlpD
MALDPFSLVAAAIAGGLVLANAARRFPVHPCPGFRISSGWGPRVDPITGQAGAFHRGIDFACPLGTPLYAPCDGVIDGYAPFGTGGPDGVFIRVRRADGVQVSFSHCLSLLVAHGDSVKAGEMIARSGNTGRSTGPHLHLAVRVDGELVDPSLYLPPG